MLVLADNGRAFLALGRESGMGVFSLLAWGSWDSEALERETWGGGM